MGFEESVVKKAKDTQAKIVLPESIDVRMQKAAVTALQEGIAGAIVFIGGPEEISGVSIKEKLDISGIEIIDPLKSEHLDDFASTFYDLRRQKGISHEEAAKRMEDPLYYGAMMVRKGYADGMVAGAVHSSGEVLRTAITVVGKKRGHDYISTCAVMVGFKERFGKKGEFIFADVSLGADTTPEQLAEIALASAVSEEQFIGAVPVVALLSFSTKGSARHETVDKVIKATEIVKKRRPDLTVDGELQADAAIIAQVAQQKCPDSPVEGRANVLIFPDLNSANIAVKLSERFTNAKCYGPIIQGLSRPVNDISRGCTFEDIVNVIAVTAVQSREASFPSSFQ